MRLAAQAKMGYYPTPPMVVSLITGILVRNGPGKIRIFDPCPGGGHSSGDQDVLCSGQKISLYVFGDEFSGNAIQPVIDEVDRVNRATRDGTRRVRIHAVGFPVMLKNQVGRGNTGERFATLMRTLSEKNGGTFVGLNSTRP